MIPVMQTKLAGVRCGKDTGNCLAASIASILELPLSAVPHFAMYNNWGDRFRDWMGVRGFAVLQLAFDGNKAIKASCREALRGTYHLMSGPGPRGCRHTVVGRGGKMVHDPHPDGEGLKDDDEWELFIPFQPVLPKQFAIARTVPS